MGWYGIRFGPRGEGATSKLEGRSHYVKYGAPLARLSGWCKRVNKCKDITVNFRVNRVLSRRLSAASRPSSRMPGSFQCESAAVAPVFTCVLPLQGSHTHTHTHTHTYAQRPYLRARMFLSARCRTCGSVHGARTPVHLWVFPSFDHGTCVPCGLACYRALATLLELASRELDEDVVADTSGHELRRADRDGKKG